MAKTKGENYKLEGNLYIYRSTFSITLPRLAKSNRGKACSREQHSSQRKDKSTENPKLRV